jgi:hypothetical protein
MKRAKTVQLSLPVLLWFGLAACTQFPEVDASTPASAQAAAYPELLPIDALLQTDDDLDTEATKAELAARAEALRLRAAALRTAQPG